MDWEEDREHVMSASDAEELISGILRKCSANEPVFVDYHLDQLLREGDQTRFASRTPEERLQMLSLVMRSIERLGRHFQCRVDLMLMIADSVGRPYHPINDMSQLVDEWSVFTTDEPPIFLFRSTSYVLHWKKQTTDQPVVGFRGPWPGCIAWYQSPSSLPLEDGEPGEHRYYLEDIIPPPRGVTP